MAVSIRFRRRDLSVEEPEIEGIIHRCYEIVRCSQTEDKPQASLHLTESPHW